MPLRIPKTISNDEFQAQWKKCKDNKLKLAFLLGFYQCMRVSEVVKLSKQDCDLDRGFIHIKEAKGGKDRQVPIMRPVFHGLRYLPVTYSIRTLQRAVKKYWPDLHFHSLRHSGATFYLNDKKVDIRQIQVLLGHSRLDTTQIYTKVTPDNLKAAFDEAW